MLVDLSHEQIKAAIEWGKFSLSEDNGELFEQQVLLKDLQMLDIELTELAEIDLNDCGDACKL